MTLTRRVADPVESESLLVFSDVHLGSDLNDAAGEATIKRSARIDRDLVRMLEHYRRAEPVGGGRWRLVIAGDFIDFIGMAVAPRGEAPLDSLTSEEAEHGLGSSAEHARIKLSRVLRRHADVFAALAEFVAGGHALTMVFGNHDTEFHWEGVQRDFSEALLARARSTDPDAFLARIDFRPWFFRWGDVAHIEHGHQYDPFCATLHVMAPMSASDPRRLARGFCDTLLRFVVRPTRGLHEHGHEHAGIAHYLALGYRLGLSGMLSLGVRFVRAIVELFRLYREHWSSAAAALQKEHERRLLLLAEATRIGLDRLRALAALQAPPLTRSVRAILASLLLDRLALGLLASALLLTCGVVGAWHQQFLWASALVVGAWFFASRALAGLRQVDPTERLSSRAAQLVTLLPAAFVVMGHTHTPQRLTLDGGASTYINVGSWAEEEPEADAPSYVAPRTHLVIRIEDGKPKAELLAWDSERGPRAFET